MNGAYTKSFNNVDFLPHHTQVDYDKDDVDKVLNSKYLKDVSSALEMETLDVYDSDPLTLYEDVKEDCDGLSHRVDNHMEKVKDKVEKDETFKELYQMMKDDFEIKDSIDFDNAGYYIDDY